MTLIEWFLVGIIALVVWLTWWFDLFCLRSTSEKCISREACKHFCRGRQAGCQIAPEEANSLCTHKEHLAEAKEKFLAARPLLKAKIGRSDEAQ